MNKSQNKLHDFHFVASVIFILTLCTPEDYLPNFLQDMSVLEKYGFSIILLVIVDGFFRYLSMIIDQVVSQRSNE